MGAQPVEDNRSPDKDNGGDSPVVKRVNRVLPEPRLVDKTVSIPLDQVIDRIQLDEKMVSLGNHADPPKDRRQPKTELQAHGNDLPDILEKDNHGRGQP